MRSTLQSALCLAIAYFGQLQAAKADKLQAIPSFFQTVDGVAGYGLVGIGGETPPEPYYVQLDQPLEFQGVVVDKLLTHHELPDQQRVQLCAHLDVKEFKGVESHYRYVVITDIAAYHGCDVKFDTWD